MAYDKGLADRVADALERIGERSARQKNVFGGRGWMLGKKAFVIVWGERLLVKLAPAGYGEALREPGVSAFKPGGGKGMGTWVQVEQAAVAEDPELELWLRRGLGGIR